MWLMRKMYFCWLIFASVLLVSKWMFTVLYNINCICWFMFDYSWHLRQALRVPHQYYLANCLRIIAEFLIHLMMILRWNMSLVRAAHLHRPPTWLLVQLMTLMMILVHPLHSLNLRLPYLPVNEILLLSAFGFLGIFTGSVFRWFYCCCSLPVF